MFWLCRMSTPNGAKVLNFFQFVDVLPCCGLIDLQALRNAFAAISHFVNLCNISSKVLSNLWSRQEQLVRTRLCMLLFVMRGKTQTTLLGNFSRIQQLLFPTCTDCVDNFDWDESQSTFWIRNAEILVIPNTSLTLLCFIITDVSMLTKQRLSPSMSTRKNNNIQTVASLEAHHCYLFWIKISLLVFFFLTIIHANVLKRAFVSLSQAEGGLQAWKVQNSQPVSLKKLN